MREKHKPCIQKNYLQGYCNIWTMTWTVYQQVETRYVYFDVANSLASIQCPITSNNYNDINRNPIVTRLLCYVAYRFFQQCHMSIDVNTWWQIKAPFTATRFQFLLCVSHCFVTTAVSAWTEISRSSPCSVVQKTENSAVPNRHILLLGVLG